MILSCRHVLALANKPKTSSLIDEAIPATVRTLMYAGHAGDQVYMC